ncbi:MAG: PAS domain S-box protein [Spartobacteria bacterium]|nr:PAS domain S-box protein [Spartobacteria bacterium]
MTAALFIALAGNISLLITIVVVLYLCYQKLFHRDPVYTVKMGLLAGLIGVLILSAHITLFPGVFLDARSILLSCCGLFFPVIPALATMLICSCYSAFQEGTGAIPGIIVICGSTLIGCVWNIFRTRHGRPHIYSWRELYLFGWVIHLFMLAILMTVTEPVPLDIIRKLWMPLLILYPLGTMFFGAMLSFQIRKVMEKTQLSESEKRYHSLSDNIPDMILRLDHHFNYLYVNPALEQHAGVSAESFMGKTFFDQPPFPHCTDSWNTALSSAFVTKHEQWLDCTFTNVKTGADIHIEARMVPEINDDPSRKSILVICRDITQRVETIMALERKNKEMNGYYNAITDLFCIIDRTGIITRINPLQWKAILGYTSADVVGQTCRSLIHPEDVSASAIFHNQSNNLKKNDKIDITCRLRCKSDAYKTIRIHAYASDDYTYAIGQDLTESMETQQALRSWERKFIIFFENMSEGCGIFQMEYNGKEPVDYHIVEVNNAYCTHTNINKAEAAGQRVGDLFETHPPPFLKIFAEVVKTGRSRSFEAYHEPLKKFFRVSAIALDSQTFATVSEDITDHKKREIELRHKTTELEQFTYSAAKDLKTPLISIRSYISFLEEDLREEASEDQVTRDLSVLRHSAEKMDDIMNEIMRVAHVGRPHSPSQQLTPDEIVKHAIRICSKNNSTMQVRTEFNPCPILLIGEKQRLAEIWIGIIDFALCHARPSEAPVLGIGVKQIHEQTVFYVESNGMPLSDAQRHNIFEFNDIMEDSSITIPTNTLAIVKRIIRLFNGNIWAEEDRDRICIKFTLPSAIFCEL